jgi:hypothetical protein
MVSAEVADPPELSVTVVGLRDIVGPLLIEGEILVPRPTDPEKPLMLFNVTSDRPEEPTGMATIGEAADIPKPITETVTTVEWEMPLELLPVTVIV